MSKPSHVIPFLVLGTLLPPLPAQVTPGYLPIHPITFDTQLQVHVLAYDLVGRGGLMDHSYSAGATELYFEEDFQSPAFTLPYLGTGQMWFPYEDREKPYYAKLLFSDGSCTAFSSYIGTGFKQPVHYNPNRAYPLTFLIPVSFLALTGNHTPL